jgi:negative regulator of flagellin synthesis FlgM
LLGDALQRNQQIREDILKSAGPVSIPGGTKPGEPDVAVNLSGIDLSAGTTTSAQKTTSTQSAAATSQEASQKPQSEVSITSTAALLARLQQTLAAKPAIDQSRVAAISKAIADGTYSVNPDKIANGLISTEHALGKLQP